MTPWKHTALVAALAAGFAPLAPAQTNEELLKELRALRERVNELERKVRDNEARSAPATPAGGAAATAAPPAGAEPAAPGMTPEQQQEFNRIALKTEALEDNQERYGFKGLKISGYMDPTFIYNHRADRSGFQFLNRVNDDNGGFAYDNSYFGAAVLDLIKETDSNTRWRLTLAPNRGVGAVFDGSSIIQEASVSIPLTDLQTRVIAGQVPDWSGYEYLPAPQNKLITHNLLFDFTLPTAYTGAGMEITRGKWISKLMLANMNASRRTPGNKTPVLAYRVDYARGEFQGFGFAGVHGKAANFSENIVDAETGEAVKQPDSAVHLFEFDAYFIRGDWTVQGQVSFGTQKDAAVTPDPDSGELRNSRWWGLSGLAAYKFTPRLEGIARLDYLNNEKNGGGLLGYSAPDDHNGIGPAPGGDPEKGANRYALSVGASYLLNLNTTLRAEYRLDRASVPVFLDQDSGLYKKSNHLFGASVLVSF
ncbi:DUF3138 family protein [Aquabacterium sp. A7-Y]|uniref:DUF3138 family protein n=1 Tax=Aquabacterium sp. A7-Y TaxID=1349605 RepID=UPI00223D642F|nr:DUF3138 family protein [Aquabacterium sp. A7-Y]MCW7541902.1 DUF3138 family protein [Aquabacterium sp. A7-Y]